MLIVWSGSKVNEIRDVVGQIIATTCIPHEVRKVSGGPPEVNDNDVVLACGGKAVEILQNIGLVPKNRTVGSLREKVIVVEPSNPNSAKILVTYEPSIVGKDYSKLPEVQWDTRLACRLHNNGNIEPVIGDYRYVDSLHDAIGFIDDSEEPVDVAVDLETVGLDEYDTDAYIVSISFTYKEGESDVVYFTKDEHPVKPRDGVLFDDLSYWEQLWVQIHWILTSPKVRVRGANFKFDSRWMNKKWEMQCSNFTFDTLLVGTLLDENVSNSLKLHAKIHTPLGGYDTEAKGYDFSRVDLIPKNVLLPYAGGDTDATLRVANVFRDKLLKNDRLAGFYMNVLHPSSLVFEKMERNGIAVDVEYYSKLKEELLAAKDRLEQLMVGCLPTNLSVKHATRIEKAYSEGKNPMTPAVLKDYLFTDEGLGLKPLMVTEKTKEPSTAVDHLMMFSDNKEAMEFITHYKEYGSVTKTLSTYVIGFLKHLRSDGMWHPSYMLFRGGYGDDDDDSGATTGRTSAKDPAVQCLVGSTLVMTNFGYLTIREIVEGYEDGEDYEVLTHTGRWRKVIGVFRNGVQPVFGISSERGIIKSTENHPYLTTKGWVRTDNLKVGDIGYAIKRDWYSTQDSELYKPNVLQLVSNEESVHKQDQQRLGEVRGQGNNSLSEVDGVQQLSGGYGGEAREGNVHREIGCERELRATELHLGNSESSRSQQGKLQDDNSQWSYKNRSSVGKRRGYYTREASLPTIEGDSNGVSLDEGEGIELRIFQEAIITGIEPCGEEETFDLTVEGSHSFVANDLVVHNTIPKHTVWSKKLRRAIIPPEGQTILQCDFSQGELKIAACVANEPTMIKAYLEGIDLHAVTAAQLNGYELEEFLELPEELRDELRSSGKAGNFGLLYGMGANGFREYAAASYGVQMTADDAVQKRDAFFALYSRLLEWHEEARQFAKDNMEVVSPLGRIRHLPLINSNDNAVRAQAERQAINSPIQSTLSDMMQLAMVIFDETYGQDIAKMFLMTHDSIALYIPIGQEELWAERMTTIMANLPLKELFGWAPQLQFTADAEVSMPDADGVRSLASLKKMKNLKMPK